MKTPLPAFYRGAIDRIAALQRADGAIPWFDAGVVDPWNHGHAAMALSIAGREAEAERAYRWLAESQETDGSWKAQYGSAVSMETGRYEGKGDEPWIRDTNFAAYIATAIWHRYLVTRDRSVLTRFWPNVDRAMGFVLSLQSEHGEIRWAAPDPHTPQDDALRTGNASIYKSLECAILIAQTLGHGTAARTWRLARGRLGHALRTLPHRFDRQWEPKNHFAMDWYYPVLSGAIAGAAARAHIDARWSEFVIEGAGCRCLLPNPWVTVAESAELVLALLTLGRRRQAEQLFAWLHRFRCEEGAYWMGYHVEEQVAWPHERPAWTAAAVVLAWDALEEATPAARLFVDIAVSEAAEEPQRAHRAALGE